jgi:hypothetical protein
MIILLLEHELSSAIQLSIFIEFEYPGEVQRSYANAAEQKKL